MLDLSTRDRVFLIAESGTCHADPEPARRFERAMDYVLAAKRCGADAVKFQMFDNPCRTMMFCWIDGDERRAHRWRASVMDLGAWAQVKQYAEACGMVFLASVFEHHVVPWLSELGVAASKVASRAAASFPYHAAPKPFLVSDGMHPIPDIEGVIGLECEANYPSTARWKNRLPGFSDHSGNPWRAVDAIARGCRLIEVHYCIDPRDAGPDLPASLSLEQLRTVCEARDAFASFERG